ncbi:MAG: CoA transferase [Magnetovibrio sp.]|nr:CoA transferase [Magnetovibrio sp.]
MDDPLSLPLEGIRIIDMTTTLAGPYASQILGDFGADIIKIEAPGGDAIRDAGPQRHKGMSSTFMGCNRNKRSVVLDLKSEFGRQALWRLVDGAHVFLHAIRPQKMMALGFNADAVMARKPEIVYVALHGYHDHGPYGGRPAYDDVIQGEAGVTGTFVARDGHPAMIPSSFVDKNTGLITANGVLAAIIQNLRTKEGVYIEVGMFEGIVAYNLVEHLYGRMFVPAQGEAGYARVVSPHRSPHATGDGFICMLPYTDAQWRKFWQIAGCVELADDRRFSTMRARSQNIDALYSTAASYLKSRNSDEWLKLLAEAEIPAGPANTLDDLFEDKHLKAIDFFRKYKHPSEGTLIAPDTPYRINKQSLPIRQPAPRMGEHTREVLIEIGYSDDHIDKMTKRATENFGDP